MPPSGPFPPSRPPPLPSPPLPSNPPSPSVPVSVDLSLGGGKYDVSLIVSLKDRPISVTRSLVVKGSAQIKDVQVHTLETHTDVEREVEREKHTGTHKVTDTRKSLLSSPLGSLPNPSP